MITKVISIILILFFLYNVLNIKKSFAVKPTKAQLDDLRGKILIRVLNTDQEQKKINLIPTPDIRSLWKPVVWFFIGEPTSTQLGRNNLDDDPNKIVKVKFGDLESDKVLYRAGDNVVGYLGTLEGKIETYSIPKRFKYKLSKLFVLLQIVLYMVSTGFVLTTFLGLDLGIKLCFLIFGIFSIILITADKLIKRAFRLKNSKSMR